MKKYYKITQPIKNIFHLEFKDSYNCGIHMTRLQEFFESPLKEVKGKHISFFKLMEIYANKFGNGSFTYPHDWAGFNLSNKILDNFFANKKLEMTPYDIEMKKVHEYCKKKSNGKYYLTASSNSKSVFKHEIAHGLFYLNDDFNKDMTDLVLNLSKKERKVLEKWLKNNQYCKEVYIDEIQAYLSTGLTDSMVKLLEDNEIDHKSLVKNFKKVFNKYYNILK